MEHNSFPWEFQQTVKRSEHQSLCIYCLRNCSRFVISTSEYQRGVELRTFWVTCHNIYLYIQCSTCIYINWSYIQYSICIIINSLLYLYSQCCIWIVIILSMFNDMLVMDVMPKMSYTTLLLILIIISSYLNTFCTWMNYP